MIDNKQNRFDVIFNNIKCSDKILDNSSLLSIGLNIVKSYLTNKRKLCFVLNSLYECHYLYDLILEYIDEDEVSLFVADEVIELDALSSSKEFDIECVNSLYKISLNNPNIVLTNSVAFMQSIADKDIFLNRILNIKIGDDLDRYRLEKILINSGYTRVNTVSATSEYAVRGMIVDIYSPNYEQPVRIELFDDTVNDIRFFQPTNERSFSNVKQVSIIPCTYRLFNQEQREVALNIIKEDKKIQKPTNFNYSSYLASLNNEYKDLTSLYDIIENGSKNMYLESNLKKYYNYFSSNTTIFDYLTDYQIYGIEKDKLISSFSFYKNEEIEQLKNKNESERCGILVDEKTVLKNILSTKTTFVESNENQEFKLYYPPYRSNSLDEIISIINTYFLEKIKVVLCISQVQLSNLINLFNSSNIQINIINNVNDQIKENVVNVLNFEIKNSIYDFYNKIVFLSLQDIYGSYSKSSLFLTRFKQAKLIKKYDDLVVGDFVVHEKYGIGQYQGVCQIDGLEYLKILYAKANILYVPLNQFRFIRKYSSKDGYAPSLDSIDGSTWIHRKEKIKNKIAFIADQLIDLYATRTSSKGFSFVSAPLEEKEFGARFPYPLTSSQERAIYDVNKDMEKDFPMDRLITGDVGFGKTEIALRAAFKAILNNKQVAFLCPTTILAKQHYELAKQRFSYLKTKMCLLSRFTSSKELKEKLNLIKEGKMDLIIGTHKILSEKIEFKNLGLLIVDEEQRFGVTHKEKIKMIAKTVDCLTLSATPIPRTLESTLLNLKPISILSDPPKNRIPIRTYVIKKDNNLIKEVIHRELARKGQVYYLFNDILRMNEVLIKLKNLFPLSKIACVHGQMDANLIDETMTKFYANEIDILVCTTIVESGLDVPNANTIIVEQANNFGLSQLYQIKGRVGRFDRMAYCYFLYDDYDHITDEGKKRLLALKNFTELGSGYKIASTDLKIRGAGDLLGKAQSGHMLSIGYDAYTKLLKQVITHKKEISESKESFDSDSILSSSEKRFELSFSIDAIIPEDYVCLEDRINIYRELSHIRSFEELNSFIEKVKDVYGTYPSEVNNLFLKKKIEIYLNNGLIEDFNEIISGYKFVLASSLSTKENFLEYLLKEMTPLNNIVKYNFSKTNITINMTRSNDYINQILFMLEVINKFDEYNHREKEKENLDSGDSVD